MFRAIMEKETCQEVNPELIPCWISNNWCIEYVPIILNPVFFSADQSSGCQETLHLSLEEAFFLSYSLGCLQVKYGEKFLNLNELWDLFQHTSSSFISKYVVYHHFRIEGWIVKSGVKFGSDFCKTNNINVILKFIIKILIIITWIYSSALQKRARFFSCIIFCSSYFSKSEPEILHRLDWICRHG